MRTDIVPLIGIMTLAFVTPAVAGTVNLSFDTVADGANTVTVQGYLDGQAAGLGTTVKITDDAGTSGIASRMYTGDNHVVGPVGTNGKVTPITLGTTDGAKGVNTDVPRAGAAQDQSYAGTNDTFLYTSNGTYLTLTFGAPVTLVSFDWEIFPDASCTKLGTNCGTNNANLADFKFSVNNGAPTQTFGIAPSAGWFPNSFCGSDVTYPNCPATGRGNRAETAPQLIGTYTTPINGVTSLTFADWPAAIGIDNVKVSRPSPPSQVPLPGALTMVAAGMALLTWRVFRKA
jgi:hypothetical protein